MHRPHLRSLYLSLRLKRESINESNQYSRREPAKERQNKEEEKETQGEMSAIDFTVLALMYAIALTIFVQRCTPRTIVATVFAAGIILHDRLFYAVSEDPWIYYLSAAIFDLIVILIISQINTKLRLTKDIQVISIASIVFNLIGWVQYMQGHDGTTYMLMYVVLYGWAVIALLRREPANVGSTEGHTMGGSVCANASPGHLFRHNKAAQK